MNRKPFAKCAICEIIIDLSNNMSISTIVKRYISDDNFTGTTSKTLGHLCITCTTKIENKKRVIP